jgi:D-3-phosphoglycerate dehydrogenase
VAAGEDAIALVGVDQELPADLIDRILQLPHVREARVLSFQ